MDKIVLDAATRAKLNGLTRTTPLYDESGAFVGYYTPPGGVPGEPEPSVYGPFTDAEIEEAFAQTDPGRPLEDILRDLRAGR